MIAEYKLDSVVMVVGWEKLVPVVRVVELVGNERI